MPDARPVAVSERDRATLRQWVSTSRSERERRARIVLLADEGVSNREIARRLGVSRPTVITWRRRYAAAGISGLLDRPRPGRPREVDIGDVVARTIALGAQPRVSTSCARRVAREYRVSPTTVARAWRAALLRSDSNGEPVFATEPAMRADHLDLAGVYVHGPCGVFATTRGSGSSYTARCGRVRVVSGGASVQPGLGLSALRALLTAVQYCTEVHAVTTPDAAAVRAGIGHAGAALSWHATPSTAAWLNLVETLLYLTLRTGCGRFAADATPCGVSSIMTAVEPVVMGRGSAAAWFTLVGDGMAGGGIEHEPTLASSPATHQHDFMGWTDGSKAE